jgi:hypothetical protein
MPDNSDIQRPAIESGQTTVLRAARSTCEGVDSGYLVPDATTASESRALTTKLPQTMVSAASMACLNVFSVPSGGRHDSSRTDPWRAGPG